MKISAVIITYNEEKNIERCLLSLKEVADEIIVLDSFSNDKTEEICKKHNVKFYRHKFDNYTNQKNRAAELAENKFVLSLDADEVLSDELIKSIKQIPEKNPADAYRFNRLNIYCGKAIKHTSWYPDRKIRLWNKEKGKWTGDKIHEVVETDNDAKKDFLKGDLLHYSFNSIEEHINQTNKFTSISASALFNEGKNSNIFIIIYKTTGSFIKEFIFKAAFMDGFYGCVVGQINVFSSFLKYVKLRKLIKDSE